MTLFLESVGRRRFVVVWVVLASSCSDSTGPSREISADGAVTTFDADVADAQEPNVDSSSEDAAGDFCNGPPDLYIDADCSVLNPSILAYSPRFWLWSDGTGKERFISFPEGSQIDTREADHWVFPVGTRIWKTFSYQGARVETRYFEKTTSGTGVNHWDFRTYRWDGPSEANEVPFGGEENALGTPHDIPSLAQCVECHSEYGPRDMVLGFGAVQLNHDRSETTLQDLRDLGMLSHDIPTELAAIPGMEHTQQALGYLHANCGHCHSADESAPEGLRLWVPVGLATEQQAPAYLTAIEVDSEWRTLVDGSIEANQRIVPRRPDISTLYLRTGIRGEDQMPPLGSEIVDADGRTNLFLWISGLETTQ
ncbi:MAG: hypothetical protein AAF355_04620 [Myxococcota bacterium]